MFDLFPDNSLAGYYQEEHNNLTVSFISYVNLGARGWTIFQVPAVFYWNFEGQADPALRFVHIVAHNSNLPLLNASGNTVGYTSITGIVHVEAHLDPSDLNGDKAVNSLLNETIKWASNFEGRLATLLRGATGTSDFNSAALIIQIYGIDSQQTIDNLQQKLAAASSNFRVPVYVIYVDENGYVQAFCVGPRCSEEVKRSLALQLFGVLPGQKVPWWVSASAPDLVEIDPDSLIVPEP